MTEPAAEWLRLETFAAALDHVSVVQARRWAKSGQIWIGEGFTTPPYSAVQYDIFEWLGVTSEQYDVTRAAVPVVGRAAPSAEPPETET